MALDTAKAFVRKASVYVSIANEAHCFADSRKALQSDEPQDDISFCTAFVISRISRRLSINGFQNGHFVQRLRNG